MTKNESIIGIVAFISITTALNLLMGFSFLVWLGAVLVQASIAVWLFSKTGVIFRVSGILACPFIIMVALMPKEYRVRIRNINENKTV